MQVTLEGTVKKPTTYHELLVERSHTRARVTIELERACRTLRRMRFPRHGAPQRPEVALGCHLPDPLPDPHTAYGADQERTTRALPTAADLDHFDRVWPWLFHADIRDRGLIYVRLAYDFGWRKIAQLAGCSHEAARYRFDDAMDLITRRLTADRDLT